MESRWNRDTSNRIRELQKFVTHRWIVGSCVVGGRGINGRSSFQASADIPFSWRKRAKSGWKEIVSALTEARKLLPTFN